MSFVEIMVETEYLIVLPEPPWAWRSRVWGRTRVPAWLRPASRRGSTRPSAWSTGRLLDTPWNTKRNEKVVSYITSGCSQVPTIWRRSARQSSVLIGSQGFPSHPFTTLVLDASASYQWSAGVVPGSEVTTLADVFTCNQFLKGFINFSNPLSELFLF